MSKDKKNELNPTMKSSFIETKNLLKSEIEKLEKEAENLEQQDKADLRNLILSNPPAIHLAQEAREKVRVKKLEFENLCKNNTEDSIVLNRESLKMGKYTRFASDLTSEQISGLLWLIGEWSNRRDSEHPRSKIAKEAIMNFNYNPLTLEEVLDLLRSVWSVWSV